MKTDLMKIHCCGPMLLDISKSLIIGTDLLALSDFEPAPAVATAMYWTWQKESENLLYCTAKLCHLY